MAVHRVPAAGSCGHALPTQSNKLSARAWKEQFWPYYQRERGLLLDAAVKTIDELFDDPAERADTLRTVAEELKTLGNDTLGPLGEAHVSYLVEERWKESERLLLVKAAWKLNPFDVTKGIDLIGVRLHDGQIYYVEVKARREVADFLMRKTLEELGKDLKLERIEKRARLSIGTAAYEYIQTSLLRLLRESPARFTKEIDVKDPRSHGFSRLGAIVSGSEAWESRVTQACPCDASTQHPCALLLLFVEQFEQQVVLLLAAEQTANRKLLRTAKKRP